MRPRVFGFIALLLACGARSELDEGANDVMDASTESPIDATASDVSTMDVMEEPPNAEVITLATGFPYALGVDDVNVYWIEIPPDVWSGKSDGAIVKCAVDGCAEHPTPIATGQYTLPDDVIAIGSTDVYWFSEINGGSILSCAKAGCGSTPNIVASPVGKVTSLALSATNVFWCAGALDPAGRVQTCPLTGCVGAPTVVASQPFGPRSLAVDDTSVYWTAWAEVSSCPLAGCITPTTLAVQLYSASAISTANAHVFWIFGSGIAECDASGCGGNPTVVYEDEKLANNFLIADGANLYFGLYRCAWSDCSNTRVQVISPANGYGVNGIAVDKTSLYWSTTFGSTTAGGVMKRTPK